MRQPERFGGNHEDYIGGEGMNWTVVEFLVRLVFGVIGGVMVLALIFVLLARAI